MNIAIIILIAILCLFVAFAIYYRRGLRFVLSYLGAIKIPSDAISFKENLHVWKNGQRGRIHEFSPSNKKPSSIIIFVTGISRDGIDDERLKKLARSLAYSGKVVFLGEFTDFAQYRMNSNESEKLLETIDIAQEKYPSLRYGIGSVCLGGIVTLLAVTKLKRENFPEYLYLHGVFLNHDEMVAHCSKPTPIDDKDPLAYETLPPDPLGKAVVLYNSKSFLNSLQDTEGCERALFEYIKNVEDSDSHVEFRKRLSVLNKADFEKIIGKIDSTMLNDVDGVSPKNFLSAFEFPAHVKVYQSHARADDVIPLDQGLDLFDYLRSKNANVKFVASDVGHGGEFTNVLGQLKFLKFTLDWSNF